MAHIYDAFYIFKRGQQDTLRVTHWFYNELLKKMQLAHRLLIKER